MLHGVRTRSLFLVILAWSLSLFVPDNSVRSADFPEPYNSEKDKDATPLSPKASAASMQLPPGFSVSVFAAEPTVRNPIAMTWDSRGRLWVAENYTYAESSQRFDLNLRDRLLILEDTDKDGQADKQTVFSDQLQMLTSVEVGRGGIYLMCPPQVLFIPDENADDIPDGPAQVILDGFEIGRTSHHNFANGLRWGPDGWLYGRCGGSCPGKIGPPNTPIEQRVAIEGGIWRYSPDSKVFEVLCHGTTNPWGHDWNEFGDLFFINTVNGHLWHGIPGAHLVRPFTLDPNQSTFELIDMHADHWHFDTGKGWQNSRSGAESYGGGHAHTGMMIYLGNQWPEAYRGNLFTFNYHGRRINQEKLEREGSGYVAKHEPDMLMNNDPFFRGMDLSYGPDGSVCLLDWSDTGECHENTGVHRTSGRIYRISYSEPSPTVSAQPTSAQSKSTQPATGLSFAASSSLSLSISNVATLSNEELFNLHESANEWFVRQARIELARRVRKGIDLTGIEIRLAKLSASESPRRACNAIYTLHAISPSTSDDKANSSTVAAQLTHGNEHVRAAAVRLLLDSSPIDDVFGPIHQSASVAKKSQAIVSQNIDILNQLAGSDTSALVRLAIASNIQRIPVSFRAKLASNLASHASDADDHNLPLLVWYGLMPVAKTHPSQLVAILSDVRWPKLQRFIARHVSQEMDSHPDLIDRLLEIVAKSNDATTQQSILDGIADGLKGRRKVDKPALWNSTATIVSKQSNESLAKTVLDLNVVFGDGLALEEVKRIVADPKAEIGIRQSAFQSLVNSSKEDIRDLCIPLLGDQRLNVIAAQGLNRTDDPDVAKTIVKSYGRFRGYERPKVISVLVSRPSFAKVLLDAVNAKTIPITDLTPYDIRQIRSLGSKELDQRVTEVWGELRDSSKEKLDRIHSLKSSLTKEVLDQANKQNGRKLFENQCSKCHRLYGIGESVGPDLTGSNRANLDFLLENIVDPSAVVNKDFRMTIIAMEDGRVLGGLVLNRNDKTLVLQTQTEKLNIDTSEIEEMKTTEHSPMPDGILDALSPQQINDLLAYLSHPVQVNLE